MPSRSSYMFALAVVLSTSLVTAAENVGNTTFLDQGWSKKTRELFYFTPQGSRFMPFAWFIALEALDGTRFADSANLERYGFIPPDSPHPLNPALLPIGFALEPIQPTSLANSRSEAAVTLSPQLGLTCAACHTGNVQAGGATIRIDGGPARLDFDSFYADLSAAVERTLLDAEVFQRFANRVLTHNSTKAQAELRELFSEFQVRLAGDALIRHPTLASGFGQLDALTQSINSLAAVDQGDTRNLRAVTAPVSYPQLWLAPELEFVQWSPIAASPIGRNGGEVLAVFGYRDPHRTAGGLVQLYDPRQRTTVARKLDSRTETSSLERSNTRAD